MIKRITSTLLLVTTFCYILGTNVLAAEIYDIDNRNFYSKDQLENKQELEKMDEEFSSIEINLPEDEFVWDIDDENNSNMMLFSTYSVPKGVCTTGVATGKSLIGNMSAVQNLDCRVTKGKVESKFTFGNNIKKSFIIPGMNNTNVNGVSCYGMIPQGLTNYNGYFFITAYCGCSSNHNSVIYVINPSTLECITTLVLAQKTHAGGITYANGYLWIMDGDSNKVYYYKYSEISTAITYATYNTNVKSVNLYYYIRGTQTLSDQALACYCTTYKGYLCIGEFYETKSGKLQLYEPSITSTKKMSSVIEVTAMPPKAQGAMFYKYGNYVYILLSTSYGRTNKSYAYVYRTSGDTLSGELTNTKKIELPCLLEEVVTYGNYTYFLFESCGKKYRADASSVIGKVCGFDNSLIYK